MTVKTPSGNRDKQGRFTKGNKASTGRVKGSRNHATTAALELMNGQLERITQGLIDAALDGDVTATKFIFDKLIAPCRENPLPEIALPSVTSAADMPSLTAAIIEAVASGELLPSQASALSSLVQNHAKALELTELEQRITALENKQK